MIGTIRKHQNWLWAVIIAVVIITFVIFFSPYSRMSNTARGPVNYGSINGQPVTEEAFYGAVGDVQMRYFFITGNWVDQQDMKQTEFQQEVYRWLLLNQEQERYGIDISSEDVAEA